MSAWICARRSRPATTAVMVYRIHRKKQTPMVPFHERHRELALQPPHASRLPPAPRKKKDQIVLTSMSMRPGRSLQQDRQYRAACSQHEGEHGAIGADLQCGQTWWLKGYKMTWRANSAECVWLR